MPRTFKVVLYVENNNTSIKTLTETVDRILMSQQKEIGLFGKPTVKEMGLPREAF